MNDCHFPPNLAPDGIPREPDFPLIAHFASPNIPAPIIFGIMEAHDTGILTWTVFPHGATTSVVMHQIVGMPVSSPNGV